MEQDIVRILLGITIVSLIGNGVLGYLWLAGKRRFRLYRANLHLLGKRH